MGVARLMPRLLVLQDAVSAAKDSASAIGTPMVSARSSADGKSEGKMEFDKSTVGQGGCVESGVACRERGGHVTQHCAHKRSCSRWQRVRGAGI